MSKKSQSNVAPAPIYDASAYLFLLIDIATKQWNGFSQTKTKTKRKERKKPDYDIKKQTETTKPNNLENFEENRQFTAHKQQQKQKQHHKNNKNTTTTPQQQLQPNDKAK